MQIIPKVPKEIAVRYAKIPGMHIRSNEKCRGCGICIKREFCKVKAIHVENGKAIIDDRRCRGCTRCVHMCPYGGLEAYGTAANVLDGTVKRVEPVVNKIMDEFEKI